MKKKILLKSRISRIPLGFSNFPLGKRLRCTRCGLIITKSALHDPYLCRQCEREMQPEERFAYLDG